MNQYIFDQHNPYIWRTRLLVFFIVLVSGGITYLVQGYFDMDKKIVKENIQQVANNNQETAISNQKLLDIGQEPAVAGLESEINDQQVEIEVQENKIEEKKTAILSPPSVIERDKNPATRLDEAMTYASPQILTGKYIDISLAHQNMVIFEDGKALNAFLISSGRKGFNTSTGTFKIENKVPRAWSKNYGLFMPYWMALVPGGKFGIHELPEWPGGYKEGANHLGIPVSHGCVRLGVGPAKQVYDWAEIGTPVVIHN